MTYIKKFIWTGQKVFVPRSGIFFLANTCCVMQYSMYLRNLNCFKCLSSEEWFNPIKLPYGLFFETRFILISASNYNQAAKKYWIPTDLIGYWHLATACDEQVIASVSLSNKSPFLLTSLADETKNLKQVKMQGTLKHLREGNNCFNCSSESTWINM